jgi:hypothetical protein
MSLGSPDDMIPFKCFLDCRQRLHRIAAANGTVVMPSLTDLGIQPEVTGTANADYGASLRWLITDRPRHVCRGRESSPRSVFRRLRKRTGQQQRVDHKMPADTNDVAEHGSLGGVNGSATGAACDRSSADAEVFRSAPSRRIRAHGRSTGAALQRQPLGTLCPGIHTTRHRFAGPRESQRGF